MSLKNSCSRLLAGRVKSKEGKTMILLPTDETTQLTVKTLMT